MTELFVEPFRYEFMQRALVAGLLVAVTTAVVGVWVVLRGLAFMGDALAHGLLPGIAVAFLLGVNVTLGAAVGAAVMVGGVNLVTRRARLTEDTGIGLLFVGMLAFGVVLISRSRSFATDLTSFLFGNALGVTGAELAVQAAACVIAVGASIVFHRPFLALCFNEQKAEVLGLRPRFAHLVMLGLVAVAIVSSFRAVGTLLVFGLLIGPPATAMLLVRRVPVVVLVAPLVGAAAVVAGLLLSYHLDTAAGATVAAVAVAAFFFVLSGRELTRSAARRRAR